MYAVRNFGGLIGTGSVGGIIRGTLGQVPSVILQHEIYVTASVMGACTYVLLTNFGPGRFVAMCAGLLVAFGVRGLAINFGWSLAIFADSEEKE
jgi:uncharacterized membrane protein YeiH